MTSSGVVDAPYLRINRARYTSTVRGLMVSLRPMRLLVRPSISSAGGVRFEAINRHAMLQALPGVFCAGEMIDWDAPTGGYLLNASLASGRAAAAGVLAHLAGAGPLGHATMDASRPARTSP